jgi:hypothetical protein
MTKIKRRRASNVIYEAHPKLYKFLIDRDVSSEIAEAAQEFIAEAWYETASLLDALRLNLPNKKKILNELQKASIAINNLRGSLEYLEEQQYDDDEV